MPRLSAEPRPPLHPRGKSGTLARAGRLLYGQNYLIPLAALCDVHTKTLRRWLDGDDIPDRVWGSVAEACTLRSYRFDDFARELARYLKE